jgi:hypothetical protein
MSTEIVVTEGLLARLYDITIQQGADFNLVVLYKDTDGDVVSGLDTCEMQVRLWAGDSTKIIDLDETSGLTINEPKGEITILIEAADTAVLDAPANLTYDLEATLDGGEVARMLEGQCLVTAGVSR